MIYLRQGRRDTREAVEEVSMADREKYKGKRAVLADQCPNFFDEVQERIRSFSQTGDSSAAKNTVCQEEK